MMEPMHGPTTGSSVVLDLGEGIGALVLDVPAELNGGRVTRYRWQA